MASQHENVREKTHESLFVYFLFAAFYRTKTEIKIFRIAFGLHLISHLIYHFFLILAAQLMS